MGMTMTQKILAAHAGLDQVKAGQLIDAKLDMVLANDITTSKRADSGLQSTGNVECLDPTGTKTILFAVEDLYYLENRIVDELAVVCE